MASKQQRLKETHKMALKQAIKILEKKKEWIIAGELNNILEKSEGTKKEMITNWVPSVWPSDLSTMKYNQKPFIDKKPK